MAIDTIKLDKRLGNAQRTTIQGFYSERRGRHPKQAKTALALNHFERFHRRDGPVTYRHRLPTRLPDGEQRSLPAEPRESDS